MSSRPARATRRTTPTFLVVALAGVLATAIVAGCGSGSSSSDKSSAPTAPSSAATSAGSPSASPTEHTAAPLDLKRKLCAGLDLGAVGKLMGGTAKVLNDLAKGDKADTFTASAPQCTLQAGKRQFFVTVAETKLDKGGLGAVASRERTQIQSQAGSSCDKPSPGTRIGGNKAVYYACHTKIPFVQYFASGGTWALGCALDSAGNASRDAATDADLCTLVLDHFVQRS